MQDHSEAKRMRWRENRKRASGRTTTHHDLFDLMALSIAQSCGRPIFRCHLTLQLNSANKFFKRKHKEKCVKLEEQIMDDVENQLPAMSAEAGARSRDPPPDYSIGYAQ